MQKAGCECERRGVSPERLEWALTGLKVGGVPLTPEEARWLAAAIVWRVKGLDEDEPK